MFRPQSRLATCAFLAAIAGTSSGRADDTETAARAIFEQATRDMDAGAYEKACPALVEVVKLSHGIGAMIKLGKCYEAQGKLASAWASFKEAAEAAHLAQDGREAAADAKARELFPKVSHLLVTVRAGLAGVTSLTIKRDDVDLVTAQWNTEAPVDSGRHVVTASAPGKKTWTGTVDVPATGGSTTLEVPLLEDERAGATLPPPGPPTATTGAASLQLGPSATAPAAPLSPEGSPGRGQRITGIALGAVGVVGLGLGGVFGAIAASDWSSANSFCSGKTVSCTTSGTGFQDEGSAKSMATASTVGFIAGGVLAAGGIVVFLTAPKRASRDGSASACGVELLPAAGAGGPSMMIRGWF